MAASSVFAQDAKEAKEAKEAAPKEAPKAMTLEEAKLFFRLSTFETYHHKRG